MLSLEVRNLQRNKDSQPRWVRPKSDRNKASGEQARDLLRQLLMRSHNKRFRIKRKYVSFFESSMNRMELFGMLIFYGEETIRASLCKDAKSPEVSKFQATKL